MGKVSSYAVDAFNITKNSILTHPFFWLALLLGGFARLFMFGSIPGGLNPDEAFAGYNAYTLLHFAGDSYGYRLPVYLIAWGSGMNALESYLMVPFIAIFGVNEFAIRLPMLIVGLSSIVAVYYLVRNFFDEKTAIGAMLLLAISPWHIILSRWALESNLAPGFVLFGTLFFIKGLSKPKHLILSALFFGLSFYAYAAIWTVLPFYILLCVLYGVWTKSIGNNRFVWISLVVFVTLVLPLFLFILVNKNLIPEIRLPFISIPKMVFFRAHEIAFDRIPEYFGIFWDILIKQSDGLPWNCMEGYGLFYPFTLPFFFVGLGLNIYHLVKDVAARKIGLSFFLVTWLLGGFIIGILIYGNVNRINIFFIPAIIMSVQGILYIIKPKVTFVVLAFYLVWFFSFEKEYFTTYRKEIAMHFCEGTGDAIRFAKKITPINAKIYVDNNVIYPRVLFYAEEDLREYISTVQYTNFPAANLIVKKFGKYEFIDEESQLDGQSVYILGIWDARLNTTDSLGYAVENFGKFSVVYHPGNQ